MVYAVIKGKMMNFFPDHLVPEIPFVQEENALCETALHCAILTRKNADLRARCVAYLLQHGARVDKKDFVRNFNYNG